MLEGEFAPSITQVVDFASLTGGHAIMRWLGAMTNHHVAPIPIGRIDDIEYADFLREFSEVVREYSTAVADGEISHAEAAAIDKQCEDVIEAAMRLSMAAKRRASLVPLRPLTMAEARRKVRRDADIDFFGMAVGGIGAR